MMEVVSYLGNVMQKDGQPYVHVHGNFSNQSNQIFGGHVDTLRVGLVLEVVITPLLSEVERLPDAATGLSLMDL